MSLALSCRAERGFPTVAYAVVAPLLAFGIAMASPAVLNDGDTFWHLATGQWILAHHRVPVADVFSFSAPGAPWSAHEWLTEVLFAWAYSIAGWSGMVVLGGAAVTAALLVVARRALDEGLAGAPLLILLLIAFSLMSGSLLVRPHLFGLLLLAIWTTQLIAARDAERAPSFRLLGVMLLWVNMHASFLLGLALIGPFALEAIVEAPAGGRLTAFRKWFLFGVAAVLVGLINPQGFEAFVYPLKVMNLRLLSSITEWRPASFDHIQPLEIALLALIAVTLVRPVRLKPLRLALLIGLIHMALHQTRQQMVLAIVAPLLLVGPMAETFPAIAVRDPRQEKAFWRGAFALMALIAAVRLALPLTRADSPTAPFSALAATPPQLGDRPVLNDMNFGGLLIFRHLRPFIDGRTDMYGDRFFFAYDRMVEGDGTAFDAALPKYGFEWALLRPDSPLAKALAARPDWRKIYSDQYATVIARTQAPEGAQ